jgi:hypothetical protein
LLGESGSAAARRAKALRQEAMVQMDSLRAVLLAFDQVNGGPLSRATASGLAETVGRVSAEAEAMAEAHRELQEQEIASLLGGALPAPQAGQVVTPPIRPFTPAPVQQQTIGNGAAAPQSSPSRKWWRNP